MLNKIVRSRRQVIALAVVCLSGVTTTIVFQNCGKVGSGTNYSSAASESGGDGGGAAAVDVNGLPVIKVSDVGMQSANLGTKIVVPINLTLPSSYSGTLKLEVLTPELKVLDPGAGIKFFFSPPTLALTGGGQAATTLTIDVTTMSPSFDLSLFHIHASDMNNSAIFADISVPLQVKAIYEVSLEGPTTAGKASPETWTIPSGTIVGFISHAEGLTFRLKNAATGPHRVHSSGGSIPHEGMDMAAGGNYTVVVKASATKSASQLYCHDHEGGGQARTFQFNLPVVPVVTAPTGSGNPNASFAFINTNVFQPKCVSCHSGASSAAGVDLSSYANVLGFLTKKNSSVSAIYLAVAPPDGTMPLNGTPLTPAVVKDIGDWIDDGAANN